MRKIHFLIAAAAILVLGGCAGDGVVASFDGPYVGDGFFGDFGPYYGGHHFVGHSFATRHFSGGGGFHGGGFHGGGGHGGGGHR